MAEFRGHVALNLPTRVETLRFDELVTGATQSTGDVRAVLESVETDDRIVMTSADDLQPLTLERQ